MKFDKSMKLFDTFLLSIAVVLVIIGTYEMMAVGLFYAYAYLMPATMIFLWLVYRKKSRA